MIDEKKLIESVWDKYNSRYNDATMYDADETKLINRVLGEIQRLIESQPKVGKWIPVSDGLPEGCDDSEIELLISTHEAYPDALFEETGFALYYPKTKSFHSVYGNRLEITEIVTAWKYLPEPYIRKMVTE